MVFELPENLHPDCGPVAWLLGTWRGNGRGDYPTIEPYEYGQELIFTHDGRPFFHYMSRAWIVDEQGQKVRDAAIETGFLRCRPEGKMELVLAHNTGFAEIWYGEAAGGKLERGTHARYAGTEHRDAHHGGRGARRLTARGSLRLPARARRRTIAAPSRPGCTGRR